jgi:hypothetical protein
MVAKAWSRRWQDLQIVRDDQITMLPRDRSIWIFGHRNRFAATVIDRLRGEVARESSDRLIVADSMLAFAEHSFALTTRHPRQPGHAIALLNLATAKAAAGLARKLPHYGKYSYTAFTGSEPRNILKGQWSSNDSALSIDLSTDGPLKPLPIPARAPLDAAIAE